MTDASLALVRRYFLDYYDDLKQRLTRQLRSSELAAEALQDAWLKFASIETLGVVHNPRSYVFSVAMNAARDRMREAENRFLSTAEVEEILGIPDDAPDPARIAEAQSDLRLLEDILDELPPRQRDILLAARLDGTPRPKIAERLGISLRLVERELHLAQSFCLRRWNRRR